MHQILDQEDLETVLEVLNQKLTSKLIFKDVELRFLQDAVKSFDGYGPPRNIVIKKLKYLQTLAKEQKD